MSGSRLLKTRYIVAVVLIVATLPLMIRGARTSVESMRVAPEQWAPASHPERLEYDRFMDRFEGNDVVVLSWDGCTVDDPRLAALGRELTAPTDSTKQREHDHIFD
ncbi:MAG: hypothetical protein CMJ48_14090, partial [Planctomycetaceae bacterium]|nr:hypothetical protein [Planctomycetaceae bacterium]